MKNKAAVGFRFGLLALACACARAEDSAVAAGDVRIRDPFVVADAEAGVYRLYSSIYAKKGEAADGFGNTGKGVEMYAGKDLGTWSRPKTVLELPGDMGCTAVWAPEVHAHNGKWHLFATLTFAGTALPKTDAWPRHEKRGTWIFTADRPEGPYRIVKRDSVTPPEWSSLDGTLVVEDGKPYMVFCHEWTQVGDGEMCLMPLKDDLSDAAGEPVTLFKASSAPDVAPNCLVTDGPSFCRDPKTGALTMIWSTIRRNGAYCVYQARSESGRVAGPWKKHELLFGENGGHGMLFRKLGDGALTLALHRPNHPAGAERMAFFGMELEDGRLRIAETAGRFTVGRASSMQTVRPRAGAKVAPAKAFAVRLAKGERESFQVLVTAPRDLKDVRVSVSDGKRADGRGVFAAANAACCVTGYVETKTKPPYLAKLPGGATSGWWPDPILDFQSSADVKAGDVQSFWVRVTCPRDQPAGAYAATLTVSAADCPAQTFPLTVRVNDFAVPKTSPLPLAVTFAPMFHSSLGDRDEPPPDEKKLFAELKADPDSPVNAWKRHREAWGDFLADYYLTPDSLYWGANGRPYFDLLSRLKEQGRLGNFNLGYWGYPKTKADVEAWRADTLPRLREAYEEAKRRGLLDRAYLYGCDEIPAKDFPMIRLAAETLKREFPGVPLLTTAYDDTYGEKSVLGLLDAFTPLTPNFDPAKAAAARARGREVWWYVCCVPHPPHANVFVESPAIEGRMLMGALTARYRPDGFLYYETSIWNARKPISKGPFTDWTARSWNVYNGDGAWTCVGPDGTPLATQRLENFRDGLEDFAYVKLLEARLLAADPSTPWARRARRALAVPCDVVADATRYTHDPEKLLAWRDELADLIEEARK